MSVGKLARSGEELVTAAEDATVQELASLMEARSVGSVLITQEGDTSDLIGIVTDRDLTVTVLAEENAADALTAADVMTENPITVEINDNIFTLCSQMRRHNIRRVPIVGEEEELFGIITLDDILWRLEDEIDKIENISNDMAGVIESESPPFGDV